MFKKKCHYLVLAFAVTYLFWGLDIVLSRLGLYEHPVYNAGIVFYVIAACSPSIAVFFFGKRNRTKKYRLPVLRSISGYRRWLVL